MGNLFFGERVMEGIWCKPQSWGEGWFGEKEVVLEIAIDEDPGVGSWERRNSGGLLGCQKLLCPSYILWSSFGQNGVPVGRPGSF